MESLHKRNNCRVRTVGLTDVSTRAQWEPRPRKEQGCVMPYRPTVLIRTLGWPALGGQLADHRVGGHKAATTGPSPVASPAAMANLASASASLPRALAGMLPKTLSMATRR